MIHVIFIHYPKPMHGIVDLRTSLLIKFDQGSEMFIKGLHGHSAGFLIPCSHVHMSQETRLAGIYVTMLIA